MANKGMHTDPKRLAAFGADDAQRSVERMQKGPFVPYKHTMIFLYPLVSQVFILAHLLGR